MQVVEDYKRKQDKKSGEDKINLNTLTKLLNIPGYKVVEIISIAPLLWTFKSEIKSYAT